MTGRPRLTDHDRHRSAGIALLDSEIADQVNEHYEDLLSQASGTDTLDDVLQTMLARIQVSREPCVWGDGSP